MWDLKPAAPEEIRGEFRPTATAASRVSICEHLPRLARVMDRCILVRSLCHSISAHGPGAAYMATGNRPGPAARDTLRRESWRRGCWVRGRAFHHTSRLRRLREGISGIGPGYLGPAFGPFRSRGRPGPGKSRVPRGVTPGRFRIPRFRGPRGPAGPVRPRPGGTRIRGGNGGPRPLSSPGRGDPPVRPSPDRARSVGRAGRGRTNTAGRHWARGHWRHEG